MKRSFEEPQSEPETSSKVVLVERESQRCGISLGTPITKRSYTEQMEFDANLNNAPIFKRANISNRPEIIFLQNQNLRNRIVDTLNIANRNTELHQVACNFIKKPGHVYHLYERPSGQKYFSMLSPDEWGNTPHNYLSSWRLGADQRWTAAD